MRGGLRAPNLMRLQDAWDDRFALFRIIIEIFVEPFVRKQRARYEIARGHGEYENRT